jgi:hypothetical protein
MSTSLASLVDKVRDLLDDYGDTVTVLGAAVTDTTGTSITLDSSDAVSKGDWLSIDYETMLVTDIATGPPYTATVRRGQRGSTAATHLIAASVIVGALYPGNRILQALNGALGKMTKLVKDAATLTVTADTFTYAIPATIDTVRRIEIENSDEASQFFVMRDWEMYDSGYFRIFGDYDTSRNIMVVGTSKFTGLTSTTTTIDSTYPDDNANAINFLLYEAAGQLLLQRQAKIAGRDSFEGMTDAFAQTVPDHSVRIARQYLAEAERYRQMAIRQEPVLQAPVAPVQNPGRVYLARL